jgi:hypothetical protein
MIIIFYVGIIVLFCAIFGCKYTIIGINNTFTFTHSCPNATVIFDTAVGFCIVQSFAPSYTKSKSSLIGGTKNIWGYQQIYLHL